jgi:pimeloyl-ACP methyl ester carboxylesterase
LKTKIPIGIYSQLHMKNLIPKLIGLWLNILALVSPRKAGDAGFYLFCTPQKTPLRDHQQQFLDTAERMSFLCDGNRIQVYRWGNGPKNVLFLHGWGSHSFRWKNYIQSLDQQQFTIYAFDAPAHGNSRGKYLNLPIYSLTLETFLNFFGPMDSIVGHSLGSFTALYTLHRLGSRTVDELVITASPGEVTEFVSFYKSVLGLSDRSIRVIREAFDRNIQHLPEFYSAKKFAMDLTIPGLILHDKGDPEAPWHHAAAIHSVWPGSQLIATAGLGHNLRSREVVSHVTNFISNSSKPGQRTSLDRAEGSTLKAQGLAVSAEQLN